jgi:leader peptidase (prepilin peptidase)/N-methyltransferase
LDIIEIIRLVICVAVLAVLAVIDFKHGIIPNRIVYPAVIVILVLDVLSPDITAGRAAVTGLGLAGFFLAAALLLKQLGAGDIKFALLTGLMAGFPGGIIALFSGVFLGGVAAIILVVSGLRDRRDTMPYGPFLAAGAVFALVGIQCHLFDSLYLFPLQV